LTGRAYGYDLLAFCRWLLGEDLALEAVTTEVLLDYLRACREASVPGRPRNVVSLSGVRAPAAPAPFPSGGPADTPGARDRLVATLQAVPQIERVIGPDELRALHASMDEGDVIAEVAFPFGFAQTEPPPGQWRGAHGSLAERHVPLLLAGAGIRPGATPDDPQLVDLAPTITTLLGVPAPDQAQGRPLREILQDPRR